MVVLHLPEPHPGSDEPLDPESVADLYAGRARMDITWPEFFAVAVRDGAASVHYHPWRAAEPADALSYIVRGVRYTFVTPTDESGARLLSSARELLTPGRISRWLRRPAVGRVRLVAGSGETDWCGIWWSGGGRAGVDFYRLTPVTTAEAKRGSTHAVGRGLARVAPQVREYGEAIAYFTNALGFDLLEDTDLGGGKRWVVVGPPGGAGAALLLARAVTPEQLARVGDQAGGRVFLFLHTDDFARDYERLRSRGVRFVEKPRHERYGTVAVFEDLYGNRWDLIQPALAAEP